MMSVFVNTSALSLRARENVHNQKFRECKRAWKPQQAKTGVVICARMNTKNVKVEDNKTEGGSMHVVRRTMLHSALLLLPSQRMLARATEPMVYEVFPPSRDNQDSINEALLTTPAGATLRIHPGVYKERVVIDKQVDLVAVEGEGAGRVLLKHVTPNPYESTLEIAADGVTIQGLQIRHSSPSVANNYAVFLRGGAVSLLDCDLCSVSGSAVGLEGGRHRLERCRFQGAKSHGLAVYGDLYGEQDSLADVTGCTLVGNGGNGVLVRGPNVTLLLSDSTIKDNFGFGLRLADCESVLANNDISGNKKGSIVTELGAGLDLKTGNSIQGKIMKM